MATKSTEIEQFRDFIDEQVKNGHANLSPEEVLDLWRCQHPMPEELQESVAAVKTALRDMEAGDRCRKACRKNRWFNATSDDG